MQLLRFCGLLLICLTLPGCLDCAKILVLFTFPGPSQYINILTLLKTLASRGHEVTSVNAFPQKTPIKNFRDIPVTEVREWSENVVEQIMEPMNLWEENDAMNSICSNFTETVLNNPQVQKELLNGNAHFDLVIVETLRNDALYGFAQHFNAPLIGLSTFGTDPYIDELVGNPSPPSYNPLLSAGRSHRMTFWDRLNNFIEISVGWANWNFKHLAHHERLYKKYFPNAQVSLLDVRKNFSLIFLNQHFSLSYPRPYVPNMIEVGGLHILHKPKPLPEDIKAFIEGAGSAGVIYFSLGSNVKSVDLPLETQKTLLETFATLPQRVLWKFENDQLDGKPDNVFISKWFPQPDVLAHPNVKLFITHGGLLSTIESINHGKPVLGLPIFFDQLINIKRATNLGYGLGLDYKTLTKSDLTSTIQRLLNEPSFIRRAQEMSERYRDKPMTSLDTAVWWTEYVLRHKGTPHMRNVAQDMNFFEYHSLDVIGTLLGGFILAIALVLFVFCKLLNYLTGNSKRNLNKKIQ